MKVSGLSRHSLCLSIGIATLAGCGGSQPPIGALGAMPQSRATGLPASLTYRVLHRFIRLVNGGHPVAPLINVQGTLYGTTPDGGSYGYGTVFSISKRGVKKTLYSFRGGEYDGANPQASLTDVNGTLYGTTFGGGQTGSYCTFENAGCGTVFTITTSGQEKVLFYFDGSDGSSPAGGLLDVNGQLYGTTLSGNGSAGNGTVYTISTSGSEKVLYCFPGSAGQGFFPRGNLIEVQGKLYGITSGGGHPHNGGTVYSITTSGSEKLLHSFGRRGDGYGANGDLMDVNGTLYGTTLQGGGSRRCTYGCGTVFAITTTGKEHVVYDFGGSNDGALLNAGLIDVNGTLYGTTTRGGTSSACYDGEDAVRGCGTIFGVSSSGAETVLHDFTGGSDGALPIATLLDVHGTLYGTTEYKFSGEHGHPRGYGTVFALSL